MAVRSGGRCAPPRALRYAARACAQTARKMIGATGIICQRKRNQDYLPTVEKPGGRRHAQVEWG
jgi:hypothetical protein